MTSLEEQTDTLTADLLSICGAYPDLLEEAWNIIANAGGGNWNNETPEWQNAAERWREKYHAAMNAGLKL